MRSDQLCGSAQKDLHAAWDYSKYPAIQVQKHRGLRVPTRRAAVAGLLWVCRCSAGLRSTPLAFTAEAVRSGSTVCLFPTSIDCFEQENF